jgi:hypothetical protein
MLSITAKNDWGCHAGNKGASLILYKSKTLPYGTFFGTF